MYTIHIAAILAIWLSMYFPGLDIVLAVIYLAVIWGEGELVASDHSITKQLCIVILWQLPAIVLTILTLGNISYYAVFMLELWLTPVLPFLSLLEWKNVGEVAVYLNGFYGAILVIMLIYVMPTLVHKLKQRIGISRK